MKVKGPIGRMDFPCFGSLQPLEREETFTQNLGLYQLPIYGIPMHSHEIVRLYLLGLCVVVDCFAVEALPLQGWATLGSHEKVSRYGVLRRQQQQNQPEKVTEAEHHDPASAIDDDDKTLHSDTGKDIQQHQQQQQQLLFQGEFSHHQQFPFDASKTSPSNLYEFFQSRHHRNLLLKGGHNPTEDIPPTHDLLEEWKQQCQSVSSTPPSSLSSSSSLMNNHLHHSTEYDESNNHSVVAVYSTVPIVPGLSIKAISYMGCRLLSNPQTPLFPMYEFTLIQDRYEAQGKKALVWLYRKLTGESTSNTSEDDSSIFLRNAISTTGGSRRTRGLCRVSLGPDHFERENTLRLSYYSMVKVHCQLPNRLLRLLPLSKHGIESKISASMVKQIKSEVLQSAEKFYSALHTWLEAQHP